MTFSSVQNLFFSHSLTRTEGVLEKKISTIDCETTSTLDVRNLDLSFPLDGEFSELHDVAEWWWALLQGRTPASDRTAGSLRTLELFCGAGGLAQGVKQFSREFGFQFESVAAADQDDEAVTVYQQNHQTPEEGLFRGSVEHLVDYKITDSEPEKSSWEIEPVLLHKPWERILESGEIDLLLAGPPCQGHSNLNNHTRRNDKRNESYLDVPALAVAMNINAVIIENVPGVVHDYGQVVNTAKSLFKTSGYEVSMGVLSASKMGWPQTRSRHFMIATRDHSVVEVEGVMEALTQQQPLPVWWAISDLENIERDEHMHRAPNYTKENLKRMAWFEKEKNAGIYDLPHKLHNETHKNGTTYPGVYGKLDPLKPAGTITSGFVSPGRGRYIHPTQRRTIDPHEAARLQGFPDSYNFTLGGKYPTSGMLTKWIGDAVPTPLGYAAALAALSGKKRN